MSGSVARGAVAGVLALALFSGCAAVRPGGAGLGSKALDEATPQALGRVIEGHRAALRGLTGTGKLQVSVDEWKNGETVRDRLRASQAIVVERPASFRLEALSPFGVTYAVASDGAQLAILIPGERTVYRGAASAPTLGMATGVAASSAEVAEVLLGLPPVPELSLRNAWVSRGREAGLATGDVAGELEPTVLLHAYSDQAPGDTFVVGFAPLPDQDAVAVVFFERISSEGEKLLEARFGNFRTIGEVPFASAVTVRTPKAEAILQYGDVTLNPAIDRSRFELPTPAGMRQAPLLPPADDQF
ncbi:hypothetical protein K2Z84_23615 [Candidatus Binatia bacterium]|nr:hypothetical protein [Candidatus Binatia bacterium]